MDEVTGAAGALDQAGAMAPVETTVDAVAAAPAAPEVGDVTPRGTVFGVRITEGETFVQFAQSGEWLPA